MHVKCNMHMGPRPQIAIKIIIITWTVFGSSGEFRVDCAYLILHLQCGGGKFHGVQQIVGNGSGGSFLRSFGPAAGNVFGPCIRLMIG